MANTGLIYAGALVSAVCGVAHALPVRRVVERFEPLTEDNRRILTMEWISEGLTLGFIAVVAVLAASAAGAGDRLGRAVCSACAGMLLVMAGWTRLTGGRTRRVASRLAPLAKTVAAALMWAGAWL
jgi:hypothetical protein